MIQRLARLVPCLLILATLPAAASPALRDAPELRTVVLANGLTLAVVGGAEGLTVATVIDAGAASDPEDRPGLAHVVEHLVLRARARKHALYGHGCVTGGDTLYDAITFVDLCPASALDAAVLAVADRLGEPLAGLTPAELAVEQAVIAHELIDRQTGSWTAAAGVLAERMYGPHHPYAHALLGTAEAVQAVTLDDATEQAVKLAPGRVVVVVASELDPDEVIARATPVLERVAARAAPPVLQWDAPRPSIVLGHATGRAPGRTLVLGWVVPDDDVTGLAPALREATGLRCAGFARQRATELVCVAGSAFDDPQVEADRVADAVAALDTETLARRLDRATSRSWRPTTDALVDLGVDLVHGVRPAWLRRPAATDQARAEAAWAWLRPERMARVLLEPGPQPELVVPVPVALRDVAPAGEPEVRDLAPHLTRLASGLTVVVVPASGEVVRVVAVAPGDASWGPPGLHLGATYRATLGPVRRGDFESLLPDLSPLPSFTAPAAQLPDALQAVRDRVERWTLRPRKEARERVRSRIRQLRRSPPRDDLADLFLQGVSDPDRRALRATLRVPAGAIRGWMNGRWRPDNLTIVVAGPVEPDVAGLVEQAFAGWTPPEGIGPVPPAPNLLRSPSRTVFESGDGARATVALWCRVPDVLAGDQAAASVAERAAYSYLFRMLREARGLTYTPRADLVHRSSGAAWLQLAVEVPVAAVDEARAILKSTPAAVQSLSEAGLARHVAQVQGRLDRYRDAEDRAGLVVDRVLGGWIDRDLVADLRALTPADVAARVEGCVDSELIRIRPSG